MTDGRKIVMPKVGFVCCIEYGALEQEVVRLVGSLRKWGGEFAECEVLAVQPRFGPALRRETLPALEELGVRFVRRRRQDDWHWYHFGNKPASLEVAEEEMDCDRLVFLDSDMLITAPPVLLGSSEYEFGACARDRNIGSRGAGDPNEEYWDQMMRVFGKRSADLPTVIEHHEKLPLRMYWNSGIFAVPRRAGFGQRWRGRIDKIFKGGVAHHEYGVQFTEQASLGIAAV
jgi:hypothetical protein